MKHIAAKILALLLLIAPFAFIGVVGFAFLDSSASARTVPRWLTVSPISKIPIDGEPVLLPVWAPHWDAWTRLPDQIVGHIFARRDSVTNEIQVLSAYHHGQFKVPVEYDHNSRCYRSRCFIVQFNLDGRVIPDPNTRSPEFEKLQEIPTRIADNILFVRNIRQ